MGTIRQCPSELLSLLGGTNISDAGSQLIMICINTKRASTGSDGSVKDGIGGHTSCISGYSFTQAFWGYSKTVGLQREMT